jgi:mannosyltransferase
MNADRSERAPTADGAAPRVTLQVRHRLVAGAVCIALCAGVVLRFSSSVHLWLDEAQTFDIARLPLADLSRALRHDGAPPLFYAMLHFWLRVFGGSDFAARALPGFLGVVSIALAYAGGRTIATRFGVDADRIGLSIAMIVALSPFAIRYSTETRMYSLVMALVLLGHLAVWRAVEAPKPRRLAHVVVTTAALLYTDYWCVFLIAVVLAILVARLLTVKAGDRRTVGRVLAAMVGGCLLFTPWLPTLLWQLQHTGTPWGSRPTSPIVVITTMTQFAGGHRADARLLTVLLAFLAALGFYGRRLSGVDSNERSTGARWECLVGATTLVVGLLAAVVTNSAYEVRYAAVVFPFFALAAGRGAAFLEGNLRVLALALVAVLGVTTSLRAIETPRTQAGQVAAAIRSGAHEGDVVAYCPDQLGPDTSRLLPVSLTLRQYTFPGFGSPARVNWVDYAARNRAADPDAFARKLVAQAGTAVIWLVASPGYLTYDDKCERLQAALQTLRGTAQTIVQANKDFEHMSLIRFAS